jgi:hypothetical protein
MTIKEHAIKLLEMFWRALLEVVFESFLCFIALVIGASIGVRGWIGDSEKIIGAWLALIILHATMSFAHTLICRPLEDTKT